MDGLHRLVALIFVSCLLASSACPQTPPAMGGSVPPPASVAEILALRPSLTKKNAAPTELECFACEQSFLATLTGSANGANLSPPSAEICLACDKRTIDIINERYSHPTALQEFGALSLTQNANVRAERENFALTATERASAAWMARNMATEANTNVAIRAITNNSEFADHFAPLAFRTIRSPPVAFMILTLGAGSAAYYAYERWWVSDNPAQAPNSKGSPQ